jgi:hypothetical protein
MKSYIMKMATVFISGCLFSAVVYCQSSINDVNLKVIIIRHAEKPQKGDNLNCQGLNRSLQLPGIINSKFGIPDFTYVPSMAQDISTKHSRMFQTVIPLAAKYNLTINSRYAEKDSSGVVMDILKQKKGTVLLVWEHNAIASIVRTLGIHDFNLVWDDNDYDSIWIINIHNGTAAFIKDKEGLLPSPACAY